MGTISSFEKICITKIVDSLICLQFLVKKEVKNAKYEQKNVKTFRHFGEKKSKLLNLGEKHFFFSASKQTTLRARNDVEIHVFCYAK